MNNKEIHIAAIQMNCGNDKETNVEKALTYIDKAVNLGAELISLPEMFTMPWTAMITADIRDPKLFFDYAEPIPGPTINKVIQKAKEHNVHIIAPIFEKASPGFYYNSSPVITPKGDIQGIYRKMHIAPEEKPFTRAGDNFKVFKTEKVDIGINTCYDINFPESTRITTLMGAKIIFCPFAIFDGNDTTNYITDPWVGKATLWQMWSIMRAWENKVFFVVINRVGREKHASDINFFGRSMIVNPFGKIIAEATDKEEIIHSVLSLDDIERARISNQVYRDFRPEVYGQITKPI